MATPLKPWETQGGGGSVAPKADGRRPGRAAALGKESGGGPSPSPVIPPRPTSTTVQGQYYNPAYQRYGNSYGGLGYRPFGAYGNGYGGFSSYGSYGSYGGAYGAGYGGYGAGYGGYGGGYGGYGSGYSGYGSGYGVDDANILRQAEERTRATFQSVESVVGAFASVTMMLESTYFAVHSCFRTLIGVVQHFTRLRNHLWSVLGALAILHRLLHWLKRLLRWLRLSHIPPSEELWEEVSLETSFVPQPIANRLWPVVMFFSVVFGVPWLLWRMLSFLLKADVPAPNIMAVREGPVLIVRALHDFSARTPDELSISAGDELEVLDSQQLHAGWLVVGKNRTRGLVPANFVQAVQPQSQCNSYLESNGLLTSRSPTLSPSQLEKLNLEDEATLTD